MTQRPNPRTLKRLKRAIRKLPRDEYIVFCAARFEDLDYEQIAARTGSTIAEVEQLLVQALASIMRDMDRRQRRWRRFW